MRGEFDRGGNFARPVPGLRTPRAIPPRADSPPTRLNGKTAPSEIRKRRIFPRNLNENDYGLQKRLSRAGGFFFPQRPGLEQGFSAAVETGSAISARPLPAKSKLFNELGTNSCKMPPWRRAIGSFLLRDLLRVGAENAWENKLPGFKTNWPRPSLKKRIFNRAAEVGNDHSRGALRNQSQTWKKD